MGGERESFTHVVYRLRGMVTEEERASKKVKGERGGGGGLHVARATFI
jgi:hypothetical protein